MKRKLNMQWNEKLKQVRIGLKLSPEEVSKKTNIPAESIKTIESGKIKNPGIFTVLKITDAYDIDLGEIIY